MKIKYIKPYEGRQPGYITDVLRQKAAYLVDIGVAEICDDQTRDLLPLKKQPEPEPQTITVNNFYLNPEQMDEVYGYSEEQDKEEFKTNKK